MSRTRIALLGTGFIADIHAESYRRFVPEAEIVAVCSRDAASPTTRSSSSASDTRPRLRKG